MGRWTARFLALLVALALAATACGDDGDGSSGGGSGGSSDDVAFDDLVGRTFASTSVEGHDLVAGSEVNLTFIDGRLSALAGCNTQNGDATIEGAALVVGELASTMMACDEALMAQDEWLAGFLEGRPDVGLDGTTLTLTSGDEVVRLEERTA